jgi:hypothetical protein
VKRVVVDPGAFVAWFAGGSAARAEFESGALDVLVPRGFDHDVLEVLAADGWDADRLARLATLLPRLAFTVVDPPPDALARALVDGYAGRAAYAAVASAADVGLLTTDERLRRHPAAGRG